MIRRPLALVLAVFAVFLAAAPANAQIFRGFTPRYTTNDNGGITLVGGGISNSFSSSQRARNSQSARPANMEMQPRTISFLNMIGLTSA